MNRRHLLFALPAVMVAGRAAAEAPTWEAPAWEALRAGEGFALLRHAVAPGVGDPAGFTLGDCSTQRNLSADGKAQARAIGAAFRANGIAAARVYSSQWCRCLDTARLLELGAVAPLDLLNSLFGERDAAAARKAALLDWLATQSGGPPLVLVTHQVNISTLTGEPLASGETVVARRAGSEIAVVGRIPPPDR